MLTIIGAFWENGADRCARPEVATNLPFVTTEYLQSPIKRGTFAWGQSLRTLPGRSEGGLAPSLVHRVFLGDDCFWWPRSPSNTCWSALIHEHLLRPRSFAECFPCLKLFNPPNKLIKEVLLVSPWRLRLRTLTDWLVSRLGSGRAGICQEV